MSSRYLILASTALFSLLACNQADAPEQKDKILSPQSNNLSNPITQQQGTKAAGLRFDSNSQPLTPLSEQQKHTK